VDNPSRIALPQVYTERQTEVKPASRHGCEMVESPLESDSSPRLFPVRHRIVRRGRDLERFLNLWRLILAAGLTVTLLGAWLIDGRLSEDETWGLAGLGIILLCALSFQLYLAWFPWREERAVWVVAADVLMVSGALVMYVVRDRAIVATNSQIVFFGYFMVVALAAVRSDPRVARGVTWAIPSSYAFVVFLAVAWREVHFAPPDTDYGTFRWVVQVSRLILLTSVTWIIHLDAARGASDRTEARHDPLTGLYNRRFLEELLAREMTWAQQQGRHLSVLLLDLDDFKAYNDTHGHLEGDTVLRQVAAALAGGIRPGDAVCRFGGDEFVVVLPNTSGEAARRLARELLRAAPPAVGLSAGVGCLGSDVATVAQLLGAADAALLRAKQAGGGVVAAG
jgi:diguanylate cyclase (GGDEF)-like protein